MPEGLKIQVGADVQQAIQGVKTFETATTTAFSKIGTSLTQLEKQVAFFGGGVNKYLPKAAAQFTALPQPIKNTEVALKSLSRTSSSATQATINLSRVIQDAPFGFIGIANNLNPLLESFQRLKAESGSTGTALKSMAASLVGAGGLGLAVSAVSSLLLVFSLRNRGAKKEVEEVKKESDLASEQQKEFARAVDGAANSVLSEAKNLKDLRGILESTTAFTNNLTDATIKQGVARLIFSQKESELQKVLSAEIEKQFLLRQREAKIKSPFAGLSTFQTEDPILRSLKAQQKLNTEFRNADIPLNNAIKRIEELNKTIGSSKGALDFLNVMGEGFSDLFKTFVGKPDVLKVKPDKIVIEKPQDLSFASDFDFEAALFSKIKIPPKKFSEFLDRGGEVTNENISGPVIKEIDKAAQAINQAINSLLSDSFSNIGEALGAALSGGDIGNAFKAFAAAIGGALQAMGKQIIGIGVAALLAKDALKTLFANPATAIFAGTALVAAGAALKNILAGGIKGFAAGGLVFGPTLGLVGEGAGTTRSNPEVIAPLDKLKGMLAGMGGGGMQRVVVTGRLRGNDMVLQNARTSRYQNRTTGR